MEFSYQFGYPAAKRVLEIKEALKSSNEYYSEEYQGKYRHLPIIEISIELLVYRIENIRTKNLQKEYLAQHIDLPKSFFSSDPYSIETQEAQHLLLKKLANEEQLFTTFKKERIQQTEPLICSDDGVVVNGNRRLCVWRELFYSDKITFKHFQTVRVAVLPNHDPNGMYDLEVNLQIRSPMKAEYKWHAIAADSKEKADIGIPIPTIAAKMKFSAEDIKTYIECYDYASGYLQSIGHADEWTLVDKQYYAFQKIVASRRSLKNPGDKELFQEIAKSMLQLPAQGDRLYSQIPKVAGGLPVIAKTLQEVFDITIETISDDDLDLLNGENNDKNENSQIAAAIRITENPQLVVDTIKSFLDTQTEIEKEKKKKSFIFDQVFKAATNLNNAVSNLNDIMSKDGIAKQLENIDAACMILKDWIK